MRAYADELLQAMMAELGSPAANAGPPATAGGALGGSPLRRGAAPGARGRRQETPPGSERGVPQLRRSLAEARPAAAAPAPKAGLHLGLGSGSEPEVRLRMEVEALLGDVCSAGMDDRLGFPPGSSTAAAAADAMLDTLEAAAAAAREPVNQCEAQSQGLSAVGSLAGSLSAETDSSMEAHAAMVNPTESPTMAGEEQEGRGEPGADDGACTSGAALEAAAPMPADRRAVNSVAGEHAGGAGTDESAAGSGALGAATAVESAETADGAGSLAEALACGGGKGAGADAEGWGAPATAITHVSAGDAPVVGSTELGLARGDDVESVVCLGESAFLQAPMSHPVQLLLVGEVKLGATAGHSAPMSHVVDPSPTESERSPVRGLDAGGGARLDSDDQSGDELEQAPAGKGFNGAMGGEGTGVHRSFPATPPAIAATSPGSAEHWHDEDDEFGNEENEAPARPVVEGAAPLGPVALGAHGGLPTTPPAATSGSLPPPSPSVGGWRSPATSRPPTPKSPCLAQTLTPTPGTSPRPASRGPPGRRTPLAVVEFEAEAGSPIIVPTPHAGSPLRRSGRASAALTPSGLGLDSRLDLLQVLGDGSAAAPAPEALHSYGPGAAGAEPGLQPGLGSPAQHDARASAAAWPVCDAPDALAATPEGAVLPSAAGAPGAAPAVGASGATTSPYAALRVELPCGDPGAALAGKPDLVGEPDLARSPEAPAERPGLTGEPELAQLPIAPAAELPASAEATVSLPLLSDSAMRSPLLHASPAGLRLSSSQNTLDESLAPAAATSTSGIGPTVELPLDAAAMRPLVTPEAFDVSFAAEAAAVRGSLEADPKPDLASNPATAAAVSGSACSDVPAGGGAATGPSAAAAAESVVAAAADSAGLDVQATGRLVEVGEGLGF